MTGFTLTCSCGATIPVAYQAAVCFPPTVMTCACGQQWSAVCDGGVVRVTLLGKDDARWRVYSPSESHGLLKELALRCLLMKFAKSDAERYGFPL